MKNRIYAALIMAVIAMGTTACGSTGGAAETETVAEGSMESESPAGTDFATGEASLGTSQETEQSGTAVQEQGNVLEDMKGLLGKTDEEAADMLGGGAENKSADGTLLVGRSYKAAVFGKDGQLHTMYDDNNKVYMIQAEVSGLETAAVTEEITKLTGTQAGEVQTGESGQHRAQWQWNGCMLNLYESGDTLFLEMLVPQN